MTLDERRAWFVYEAARIENQAAMRPINPEQWEDRSPDFRTNMVKAVKRQCGPRKSNSPKELHDRWVQAYQDMGWKYGPIRDTDAKTHPDIVPYSRLGRLEREKDWVFMALCEIAERIK